ncbi:hypothetical protein LSH36_586g00020 [Paralvinella palmiformis]|uniref:Aladin seven-bladed propeller domain-containing protein n=1 Tax=Paralvinella palmiformis TaxID=53620 RepID=A0AAD9MWT8_9ANNE|nr:hypothetical protein LSH36_586g00020 [Paralvinella palmiformis]
MSTLYSFPPPPPEGMATVCEKNAELIAVTKCDLESNILIQVGILPEKLVRIWLVPRLILVLRAVKGHFSRRVPAQPSWNIKAPTSKRIIKAWYGQGLGGVLEELSKDNMGRATGAWYTKICYQILGVVRWLSSWHGALFPHLSMPSEDLVAEFSSNLNWKDSQVRCLAWHPHTTKLAISLHDDSIKVYPAKKGDIIPTLKHKLQKCVADLAWKPHSASILAVACQNCVLLWKVDPNSLATRPSSSSVQVLSQHGHCPVTSLSWCPQGGVLVTASPTDTAILVWDVAMETCVPLRRVGGGGVCFVKWSPDGSKLLSTCPSPVFRVWECQKWTCEKWDKLAGRCQAACWSPNGRVLLFSTVEQPIIYCLTFLSQGSDVKPSVGGSRIAINVCDLSEVNMETDCNPVRVGGTIQNMVWDPTGERLAVVFRGPRAENVALFQTRLDPVLELIPWCGHQVGWHIFPYILSVELTLTQASFINIILQMAVRSAGCCFQRIKPIHIFTCDRGMFERLYCDVSLC